MKYGILEGINGPSDVKKLDLDGLRQLCNELRDYIITCCSSNPGHLGSSLGAVETIVAMHYVYDTPADKLIFDVGHQAYAHKILTGRREAFLKNRTREGISGFPNMKESPYDAFGAGHSSTSISAALGYADAARIKGDGGKVVALIGDGALGGGLAFEGLNNAGTSKSDILIILNDNNQSIDSNTGAFHEYLLRLTTAPGYNRLKSRIWQRLGDSSMRDFLQKITKDTKSNLVRKSGGALFEALGFRYFGPVDGNDIEQMVDTLRRLKELKGPRILHIHTVKGKGYSPAEADPAIWHAPGIFDPESGKRKVREYGADRYQDVFGQVLCELASSDPKIVGVTPAMASGCGMTAFAREFPERFFDVGIEEEHAVTFSAGLAAGGLKPYCNIYSSFSQRAYDQIIHDVALQGLHVVICLDRAGLVGEDGATHHGCYDLAAYRSIPGTVIAVPSDETELRNMMHSAADEESGPYIIRYPRGNGEGRDWKNAPVEKLKKGRGRILLEGRGSRTAVLALGPCANRAVEAATAFEKEYGERPAVCDLRFLKPFDNEMLVSICKEYDKLLTVEDGCLKGGLYGEVCEQTASMEKRVRVQGLGIPDRFIPQDRQSSQRHECGIDTDGIFAKLKEMRNF